MTEIARLLKNQRIFLRHTESTKKVIRKWFDSESQLGPKGRRKKFYDRTKTIAKSRGPKKKERGNQIQGEKGSETCK